MQFVISLVPSIVIVLRQLCMCVLIYVVKYGVIALAISLYIDYAVIYVFLYVGVSFVRSLFQFVRSLGHVVCLQYVMFDVSLYMQVCIQLRIYVFASSVISLFLQLLCRCVLSYVMQLTRSVCRHVVVSFGVIQFVMSLCIQWCSLGPQVCIQVNIQLSSYVLGMCAFRSFFSYVAMSLWLQLLRLAVRQVCGVFICLVWRCVFHSFMSYVCSGYFLQ